MQQHDSHQSTIADRKLTINGEEKTLKQWARFFDIPPETVYNRYHYDRARDAETLFMEQEGKIPIRVIIEGKEYTLRELAVKSGLSVTAIKNRLKLGISGTALFSTCNTPKKKKRL